MKKEIKKIKSYWAYILLGIFLILLAIILAPFWGKVWQECPWKDWGTQLVSYAMAILILLYLFGYLIKKVKNSSGTIQVLTIIEFTLLILIAIGLVFSQLKILNIPDSPSTILGIAVYLRGVIEIFRAYYYQKSSSYTYSVSWLVVAILFVTFGVFLMCTNLVSKVTVLLVLVFALVVMGITSIVYGLLAKPEKKKITNKK